MMDVQAMQEQSSNATLSGTRRICFSHGKVLIIIEKIILWGFSSYAFPNICIHFPIWCLPQTGQESLTLCNNEASLIAQLVKKKKKSVCNAGDPGSIPRTGRSPEGSGNPLQYSCLENPMDRGAWRVTAHGVTRVRHNLVTKPPPPIIFGLSSKQYHYPSDLGIWVLNQNLWAPIWLRIPILVVIIL